MQELFISLKNLLFSTGNIDEVAYILGLSFNLYFSFPGYNYCGDESACLINTQSLSLDFFKQYDAGNTKHRVFTTDFEY